MSGILLFTGSAICVLVGVFAYVHTNKASREKIFIRISIAFLIGEWLLYAGTTLFVGNFSVNTSMIQSAAPDVGTYLLVKAEKDCTNSINCLKNFRLLM